AGFGIDMADARDRFWEAVDVISLAWAGHPISHQGRFWQFENMRIRPTPVQERLPLYVASISPETFDMVLERDYRVMASLMTNSMKAIAPRFLEFRSRMGSSTSTLLPILVPVYVGETTEGAIAEVESEMMWYSQTVGRLIPDEGAKVDAS